MLFDRTNHLNALFKKKLFWKIWKKSLENTNTTVSVFNKVADQLLALVKLIIKHWSFHENFPKKPKQFFHRKLVKAHSVLLKLNKSSPTGIGNLFLKKKSFVFSELRLLSSWFIFYDQSDGTCYKCYQYKRLLFIFYLHSWNFLSAASNIGFSFCLLGNSDCWRHAFCKNLLSI